MNIKRSHAFFALLLVLSISTPFVVRAQLGGSDKMVVDPGTAVPQGGALPAYTPLEPLPGIDPGLESGNINNFPRLFNGLFKLLLGLGAILAVGSVVWGGIVYMTSEVIDRKSWAIAKIKSSLWGLLLLIAAFVILNTINPQLVNLGLFTTSVNNVKNAAPATTNAVVNNVTGLPAITDANTCAQHTGASTFQTQAACIAAYSQSLCTPIGNGVYCGVLR